VAGEVPARRRAVGYTRVSTAGQLIRPEDDRARIEAACTAYGFDLVDFVEDPDLSGKVPLADRPAGRRVHDLIEARRPAAEVLIVTNVDRLTRESEDGMGLIRRMIPNGRRRPVQLMSLDDHIDLTTATGRLFARFKILFAEYERELIGERTAHALQHMRRTGRAYSPDPYGWAHDDDGRLVAVEAEQAVLDDMRDWREAGVNDHAIATRLNAAGIPGKRGGRWQANTVYRILRAADEIAAEAAAGAAVEPGQEPRSL
jgi:DNA invertase Pin-like site-specific DNA recombinase